MAVECDFLTFKFEDKEYKSRRINLSDYSASRERIRRERLGVVPQGSKPEVMALVIAQPISSAELMDWMMGIEGQAFVLYRCLHSVDEGVGHPEVERMVFEDDPFVLRLYVESKVVKEADPIESETSC